LKFRRRKKSALDVFFLVAFVFLDCYQKGREGTCKEMYKLSQEQEILRETIRDFARKEIAPFASQIDSECYVPSDLLRKLPQLGLFGITAPAELGGAGSDFLSLVITIEEISKASGSVGAQLSIHNALVCESILLSDNQKLRQLMLQRLTSGSLGAFVFFSTPSEIDDRNEGLGQVTWGGPNISCKFEGNEILVEGSSSFVMNAAASDVFVVLAKVEGSDAEALVAFSKNELASKEQSGLQIGKEKKLLGMRASATASVRLEGLRLPIESLICDVSKTREMIDQLLIKSRLAVAAQALGIAQACLDSSLKYANERKQFNSKIGKFYAVQDMVATDVFSIETSRSVCYDTASRIGSASSNLARDSAIAKICSSNAAVAAARHSIRIHGGYGFTRDYPVERYARDARLTQIYPESNEYLKSMIASLALGFNIS
jgi:butyryl-CoA dehydrogenase